MEQITGEGSVDGARGWCVLSSPLVLMSGRREDYGKVARLGQGVRGLFPFTGRGESGKDTAFSQGMRSRNDGGSRKVGHSVSVGTHTVGTK